MLFKELSIRLQPSIFPVAMLNSKSPSAVAMLPNQQLPSLCYCDSSALLHWLVRSPCDMFAPTEKFFSDIHNIFQQLRSKLLTIAQRIHHSFHLIACNQCGLHCVYVATVPNNLYTRFKRITVLALSHVQEGTLCRAACLTSSH